MSLTIGFWDGLSAKSRTGGFFYVPATKAAGTGQAQKSNFRLAGKTGSGVPWLLNGSNKKESGICCVEAGESGNNCWKGRLKKNGLW